MSAMVDSFSDAFDALIGNEGGFTANPQDSGNWTGGKIGVGECKGTKYGVSAAQYPKLDIKNLTLTAAKTIVKRDYWDKYNCGVLDPAIAFQVLDAAYNGGYPVKWLQQAVGVNPDGAMGVDTLTALRKTDPLKVVGRFNAYRLQYLASLNRPTFSNGWMKRIAENILRGFL